MRFKRYLTERINPSEMEEAEKILAKLKKIGLVRLPSKKIGEVTKRDGSNEKNIMIRVKPEDEKKEIAKKDLMTKIQKILKTTKNVKSIQANEKSPNSSKFPSVSFVIDKRPFDIVIANGSNEGEKYEQDLLQGLISHHLDGITDEYLEELEIQMEEIDPTFEASQVETIVGREGNTRRSNAAPENVGPIIADIIIKMKDGSKKYISIKNKKGSTFANLGGVGPTFSSDLKMDPTTEIGKLLVSLGFEPEKINEGLKAYESGKNVDFESRIKKNEPVNINSELYNFLLKSWGWGYFYIRELKPGFKVKYITEKLVKETLLDNLFITELFYPDSNRKQIGVKFGNDLVQYYLEIRNSAGKVRPNDAKVKINKMNF